MSSFDGDNLYSGLLLLRRVKICTALNKENAVFCRAENAVVGFSENSRVNAKCCIEFVNYILLKFRKMQ